MRCTPVSHTPRVAGNGAARERAAPRASRAPARPAAAGVLAPAAPARWAALRRPRRSQRAQPCRVATLEAQPGAAPAAMHCVNADTLHASGLRGPKKRCRAGENTSWMSVSGRRPCQNTYWRPQYGPECPKCLRRGSCPLSLHSSRCRRTARPGTAATRACRRSTPWPGFTPPRAPPTSVSQRPSRQAAASWWGAPLQVGRDTRSHGADRVSLGKD